MSDNAAYDALKPSTKLAIETARHGGELRHIGRYYISQAIKYLAKTEEEPAVKALLEQALKG